MVLESLIISSYAHLDGFNGVHACEVSTEDVREEAELS
jgi:hypothetical protein